jgi:hypothetical protein
MFAHSWLLWLPTPWSVPKRFPKVPIEILRERFICGMFICLQNRHLYPYPHRYVDLHKAYSVILGNLYKTLYNIITRRQTEQDAADVRAVLEKRERSDVSQDESLLSRLERDILAEWSTKQERLAVLEMRVEETVFLLKDLGVLGINDD